MTAPDRLASALADRYRLERELGAGGMATVYLAQDLKHDRQVAIKVLRPELAAVIGADRFLAEIRTTANLQHPHILPLFDSGAAESFLFYVMPYVAGISLRDRMTREKQLPIAEAVRLATEVAAALDYAHRHGVIHRDIKPENIMLHDGSALVADFGIALAASKAGSRMTETGMSLGTPQYMSPEQAMGERELDARSDVYALGCVTYEMLTGEPPFSGPTAQAIVAKVMTAEPVDATTLRKTIPVDVADAVHGAIQKLPADRPASAREFAQALAGEGRRAGGPVGRRATATHPTSWPPGRPAVPALQAAALLLTAAVAAWGWLRPAPPEPVSRFSIVLPANHVLRSSQASRIDVARDGSAFLYAGASPAGTGIFLRTRESLATEMVPGSAGAVNPAFSPDGQQVAFVQGQPRAIRVVPLAGGVPRTLVDSLVDLGGVSWGYDGHIYYDGHLDGDGLARVREAGGPPQPVTRADSAQGELWHFQPEALPNGRGVLFTVNKGGILGRWFVAATEVGTGSHRILLEGSNPRYAPGYLFYMTPEAVLMGVAFDQDRLELQGDPQPILDGVGIFGLMRSDFAISTTGTVVYAPASAWAGDTELVWVTKGGMVTPVDTTWRRPMLELALAPDGRQVALTIADRAQWDIWVKPLDRGTARRISSDALRNRTPTWLPGGGELLFVSAPGGQTTPQGGVMRARADGNQLPQVFREGLLPNYPSVTRDGHWLLLDIAGNIQATRLAGDTALTAPIPQAPGVEVAPLVSPDGRWLGYLSDEKGLLQLVVRPFPSTGGGSHTVSPEGAINWHWSPDGRELYYQTEAGDLMAAEVLPGAAFAVGERRLLFNLEQLWPGGPVDWKPSPDGSRFLMLRPVRPNGRPDELIVIENFLTEVRTKVPR